MSSTNGKTKIESVTFNGAAMSGGSTLSLSGNLLFEGADGAGISASFANQVTSFNTNAGNSNCDSDSKSIGAKRFGIIQMQQRNSAGSGCVHSAGETISNTITHTHGTDYIVFLTTARNKQYQTNPLLWGVSSRSSNAFDIYFHNPDVQHTVGSDAHRYQVAFLIVKTA